MTVYRLCERGELLHVRVSSAIRFLPKAAMSTNALKDASDFFLSVRGRTFAERMPMIIPPMFRPSREQMPPVFFSPHESTAPQRRWLTVGVA